MRLKDILPQTPVDITIRSNAPKGCEKEDILFGFCRWDGSKLVSLDGDDYELDDEIVKYEYESDGSLICWIAVTWT